MDNRRREPKTPNERQRANDDRGPFRIPPIGSHDGEPQASRQRVNPAGAGWQMDEENQSAENVRLKRDRARTSKQDDANS